MEPTVIQHEGIHAGTFHFGDNIPQLLSVKSKFRIFPVVDHHRAGALYKSLRDQILPVEIMVCPAQAAVACIGIGQHRLRCLKTLARLQQPGEVKTVNAAAKTHNSRWDPLSCQLPVAGVDQIHAVGCAPVLICIRQADRQGRIDHTGGNAPFGVQGKDAPVQTCRLPMGLCRSVACREICPPGSVLQGKRKAEGPVQTHRIV